MIVDERNNGLIVSAQEMIAAHPLTYPTVPLQLYDGYAWLKDIPPPPYNVATHRAERSTKAVLIDGEWNPQYKLIALTQDEIDAARRALVPTEVPRWAGRVALKRHVLESGELVLLGPTDTRADTLFAAVTAWRAGLPDGELAVRVEEALDAAKDWTRDSDTVAILASVLGLSDAQVDALFIWSGQQRV